MFNAKSSQELIRKTSRDKKVESKLFNKFEKSRTTENVSIMCNYNISIFFFQIYIYEINLSVQCDDDGKLFLRNG